MDKEKIKRGSRLLILLGTPLLVIFFLYQVRIILLPFILAVLVSYLLNPMISRLERKGLPRIAAIIIVYSILTGLITGAIIYVVPVVTREVTQFGETVPIYIAEIQSLFQEAQNQYSSFSLPESFRMVMDERIRHVEKFLLELVREVLASFTGFFSFLISFAIAPFLAFYILKDLDNIKKTFEGLLPSQWRGDCLALLRDIDDIVTGFLRGNLAVAFLVGLLSGFGYWLVGMDYGLILGVIAGFTDLIPFFGPFLGAVPAVALALLASKALALKVILTVIIVQQIESQVLTPKIMGDAMGLNPLVIIFVLLAGGELFGLVGILLAVPIAAIIRVVSRFLFYKLIE